MVVLGNHREDERSRVRARCTVVSCKVAETVEANIDEGFVLGAAALERLSCKFNGHHPPNL